ncbi:FecR domain-containing protein [Pseudomonas sp. JH-2]|uniref:FecR family protein n=1 Tax=Pseudomonas sp. JH-2 TaxID=3114998 RepID=UPI002E27472A|nr:FecR domain-containing protein [Pseudomonas sp. JH-2]
MSARRHQAARWFTRLLDLPNDHPERQAFARWLAADPQNAKEYQAFSELWGNFSSTPQTQALASAMENLSRRRFVRNGALGGLLLAVAAGWLVSLRSRQGEQMLATGIGERRRVTLEDGSELFLDADTRLHVLFGESTRQVFLLRGRAIFSVQHAPSRPFVVDAGAAQVRVLGTRFVVERLEPQVQVSVAEGRVEFSSAGQRMVLERDQVGELDAQGKLHLLQRSAASAFSFSNGSLAFDRANLGEIAANLSRYRETPVKALQPASRSITAVVQLADVESFLALLPELADVRIEERGGATLLVPR